MSATLVLSRKRKLTTRRPCGNQTKATQPETQPSNRTNAAQLRVKNVKPRDPLGKDKRATLAGTKDRTTTVTDKVSRKPLIAVVNHKDDPGDSKSTRAHRRNWKVAPVQRPSRGLASKLPQPAARKTASQRPQELGKRKAAVLKTTTTTTTATTIHFKHHEEQESIQVDITTVPQLALQSSKTELICKQSIPEKCNNPQLCGEYAEEIFTYLLTREKQPDFIINDGFLDFQSEVKTHHRRVLVDWLVQVQERFSLLPETLHICIDILDRYLQVVPVLKAKLQLVGVTSLFIAAKYEEIYPPASIEMAYITADTFTVEDIRKMEREILYTLDYLVNKPMSLTFLRRYSKLKSASIYMHNLAKYILELSFMYSNTSSCLPSLKAAAALLIADSLLTSSPKITFHHEYKTAELLKVKKAMFTAFKEGHINKRFKTIRRKFSSSQYHEVSKMAQLEKYS